jgi:hypothetical protein
MAFVAILSTMLLHEQLVLGHDVVPRRVARAAPALAA